MMMILYLSIASKNEKNEFLNLSSWVLTWMELYTCTGVQMIDMNDWIQRNVTCETLRLILREITHNARAV